LVPDVAGGAPVSVRVIVTLGNKVADNTINMNVSACGAQAPTVIVDRPSMSSAKLRFSDHHRDWP
jgi:hypothetical protein